MAGLKPMLSPEDHAALSAWRLGPVLGVTLPATGTVNRTVLVHTVSGAYAPRAYRRRAEGRARVAWEHTVISHAATQGIPVCRPIPLPSGETVWEKDGRLFALFPSAPGRQVRREELGDGEVAAAGRCLARVHLAFADFPLAQARHKPFTFDAAATLDSLTRIEAAIRSRAVQTDADRDALRHLARRGQWLQQAAGLDEPTRSRFAALPCQVVHGDFQETNLFFEGAEVSAVIDWDQCGVAPRAWEVLRALHLMLGLAPGPCRVFLAAYCALCPLPEAELQEAAACYGVLADQNLWVYEAVYLEGNDRVHPFLALGAFVPFTARWRELARHLGFDVPVVQHALHQPP